MYSDSLHCHSMQSELETRPATGILRLADVELQAIASLLDRYGLSLETTHHGSDIPGSFWGDDEAGLVGHTLHARNDTPAHSILHEACHYVCMPPARRNSLHTNADGDYDEENAVCYLQILLADYLGAMGRPRMFADMDAWGYSFRLGHARAWFERDAEDARAWLLQHGLITDAAQPTWRVRGGPDQALP